MKKIIHYFKKRDKGDGRISTLWSFLLPAVAGLIFGLVYWNFVTLPDPLMYSDESSNPNDFIAENAKMYLRNLTSQGPRVAGSDTNEIFTVNFLVKTIEDIRRMAHPSHRIEIDVQEATGGMHLDYETYPMTSYYKGLQNVVVKITPATRTPANALLLNSHFDSVPSSPGAGDDGTMVVIMLECLRKITQVGKEYRHALIFLFNGSEENTLQGSHAFITLHRWAKDVRAVINLDVAANGGREIMFQAGPDHPWLMNYYRKHIKHPYANTMGEELFQADLVPSETDYKNFVDFGNIPGMDFAHSTNGYFYHTKYDAFDTIPLETLQHTGDNILSITKALADSSELENIESHADGKAIFFDFLNWFMIYYSETTGIIINILISVAAIGLIFVSIYFMAKKSENVTYLDYVVTLGIGVAVQILSIVLGTGITFFLAFFYDLCNRSMTWFTENWLIFGLYFVPYILGNCLCQYAYFWYYKLEKKISLSYRVQLLQHSFLLVLTLLIIGFTAAGIRSAYIALISVIFNAFTLLINIITTLQSRDYHWAYITAIGQIIPFTFLSALTLTAFGTFIAMAGRGNSQSNPEIIIALFSVLMTLFMTGFMIPLMNLMRGPKNIIVFLLLIIFTTAIVMATPAGFPYKENETPQRYYVFHVERIFHEYDNEYIRKNDSGFYMHPQDRHSPDYIREYVPQMSSARRLERECDDELYCGMPFYLNTFHSQRKNSHWIPAEKPYFYVVPQLNVTSVEQISLDTWRHRFKVSGPDHMSFYISPVVDAELVGWSFINYIPHSGKNWNGQKVYFVNYFHGIDRTDFEFYIDIKQRNSSRKSFDFALAAQYMHNDDDRTEEFMDFINRFPKWANVIGYMSYYEGWQF